MTEVTSATQSGQMMQMRKMDGSGGGKKGGGGMSDVMQNLSEEDRQTIADSMQSLPADKKAAAKEQMRSIDPATMSQADYMKSLLSAISSQTATTTGAIYA